LRGGEANVGLGNHPEARDGAMMMRRASVVVLATLLLCGCSKPARLRQIAENLRDHVASDGAQAALERKLEGEQYHPGGWQPNKKLTPAQAAAAAADIAASSGLADPSIKPGDTTTAGGLPGPDAQASQPLPPPVIYYAPPPQAAPPAQ
jgi:hypothetical protein